MRQMNVRDGYALQLAIKKRYNIIIISGSYSAEAQIRLEKLGINKIYMQVENKLEKLKELITAQQLNKEEILYMGDDIPDYEVMQYCGLATCPADAACRNKNYFKIYFSIKRRARLCKRCNRKSFKTAK